MSRPRLIPCLLLKHGLLVRSQGFRTHQVIGNPISTVERLSNWNVDELLLLDISRSDFHDLRRDDLAIRDVGHTFIDFLESVAEVCMMPLTVGGRIRSLDDIARRLRAGADKCVVNTHAVRRPEFITEAAEQFGSQCVVVNIDTSRLDAGRWGVRIDGGRTSTDLDPVAWAREVEHRGAGEIFLNSIDRDGTGEGYDLEVIRAVAEATTIPVIACGGVGRYDHLAPGITEGGANAVAAANIFHFFELSYPHAKQACIDAGVPMRPVGLGSRWQRREPVYDFARRDADLARRRRAVPPAARGSLRTAMRWCTRCVYPSLSAAPMSFDEQGVCMGCRMAEVKNAIPQTQWTRRTGDLARIFERHRGGSNRYDCIIPVSGGKDSYFQTHVITREFGLNPLLVTYNGNNYTETGWSNVHRMKEVFDVDHVFFSPKVSLLEKLNRLAFEIMGDMNWHAHVGITTYPIRVAAQERVPLVVWGEHGYLDLSGQFSLDDYPEMSYRDRLEHFARAYEWTYFVGLEDITAADMIPWQYPSDRTLFDLGIRGIYLGNYLHWEANDHGPLMQDLYGWAPSPEPFDRTYRTMSNLDDMHENGVHDYLKYIKFGYGRCTDHVCKDIRAGLLTRDAGIELVRQYDHVKPRDLQRWLEYVGMTEATFDRIADTFRDPRVWRWERSSWVKDEIPHSTPAQLPQEITA